MPRYISFFSYTPEAAARMIDTPDDRTTAMRDVTEAVGCRLECFYWMFGPYDGVTIFEAPDAVTAGACLQGIAAGGSLRRLETHQLLDMGEAVAMQRAAALARERYRRPGG